MREVRALVTAHLDDDADVGAWLDGLDGRAQLLPDALTFEHAFHGGWTSATHDAQVSGGQPSADRAAGAWREWSEPFQPVVDDAQLELVGDDDGEDE